MAQNKRPRRLGYFSNHAIPENKSVGFSELSGMAIAKLPQRAQAQGWKKVPALARREAMVGTNRASVLPAPHADTWPFKIPATFWGGPFRPGIVAEPRAQRPVGYYLLGYFVRAIQKRNPGPAQVPVSSLRKILSATDGAKVFLRRFLPRTQAFRPDADVREGIGGIPESAAGIHEGTPAKVEGQTAASG